MKRSTTIPTLALGALTLLFGACDYGEHDVVWGDAVVTLNQTELAWSEADLGYLAVDDKGFVTLIDLAPADVERPGEYPECALDLAAGYLRVCLCQADDEAPTGLCEHQLVEADTWSLTATDKPLTPTHLTMMNAAGEVAHEQHGFVKKVSEVEHDLSFPAAGLAINGDGGFWAMVVAAQAIEMTMVRDAPGEVVWSTSDDPAKPSTYEGHLMVSGGLGPWGLAAAVHYSRPFELAPRVE